MSAPVVVTCHGAVTEIMINRPKRRNALTVPVIEALGQALADVAAQDDAGAVLLCGAAGAFCSGLDLNEIDLTNPPTRAWIQVHEALDRVPVPIIAAVAGPAVNAGAALALACDLLVVGETSFIQVKEAAMGMAPPVNAAWLARGYPASFGMQLALSCRPFYGPDLWRVGAALDVLPDADVVDHARALAQTLASFPRRGATLAKQALRRGRSAGDSFSATIEAILAGRSS